MFSRKSQSLLVSCLLLSIWIPFSLGQASASLLIELQNGNQNTGSGLQRNSNVARDTNSNEALRAFEREVEPFAGSQARLGDELASLPGPQIDFSSLMRVVITWAATLASSVALFKVVWSSFVAISGTEEAHNQLKRTLIKVLIGLTVILFSYQLVALIMGLIWAGSSS